MPTTRSRRSRVFTISFPDALARQVEQTAREESRNISELFREAWRLYRLQLLDAHVDDARRRALANPSTGRKDEIESYVHAVRRARANGLKV